MSFYETFGNLLHRSERHLFNSLCLWLVAGYICSIVGRISCIYMCWSPCLSSFHRQDCEHLQSVLGLNLVRNSTLVLPHPAQPVYELAQELLEVLAIGGDRQFHASNLA